MASNPAFNRLEQDAQSGYAAFQEPGRQGGANPNNPMNVSYAQQGMADQWGSQQQLQDMYNQPSAGPVQTGRVTMDDVIMKTLGLFALVLGFGAVGWIVAMRSPELGFMLWMGGMIGTLVLGLVIAFKKTLSVPLIVGYAVLEGLFVGAVSQVFEERWPGVVATAAVATAATFIGMFLAYKSGLIKVTDKFRRIVTMMIFGYAIFAVVNFLYAMFFPGAPQFGFGGDGPLGIAISVFAVGLASVSLALDFDMIDRAIATGAPQKYSWLLAHGLIVTVVWLYIEFLRLFARMRE
ncbi:putative YccA/Bax inhibitor family protein [Knoellia remsis]|uniref:Putative YccA/Bax inhibitor family protein n=1 Tax=Knoellia remsis TaxID=407159 RepID=A0A2T0UJL4_9MICO|nr:Bax inhibitor-1/YccA family protein [Knoellia remsis]PRY58131.1 putative YccA/Bax inhibitor family protein [Knoellia remsis]